MSKEDVWEKYDKPLGKFSFSTGIIPRALLGSGEPYPIFIFGESEIIEESSFKYHTHEVRIIGGVNLQDCPKVNCRGGHGEIVFLLAYLQMMSLLKTLTGWMILVFITI